MEIRHLDKLVGVINSNNEFVSIRRPEHFFRKYKGFGLSYSVIERLKKSNVEIVKILFQREDGTASLYVAYLNDFLEKGAYFKDQKYDFQRILELKHFRR